MSKDNMELSINSFPESDDYKIIPIGFQAGTETVYSMAASEILGFDPSVDIILEDLKENTFTNLVESNSYSFTASPLDEPLRFLLHFNGELAVPENLTGTTPIKVYSYEQQVYITSENNMSGLVCIYDLPGKKIISERLNNQMIKKINLAGYSGYLIVSVTTDQGITNQKVFLK